MLRHGLVLERIHRAIEFNQMDWMKPYIDFNTKLRTAATNDFEKDFPKLMNNSVFGKTMENISKHRNIKLVTTEEKYLKTVMKPNFKSGVLFGENLMGCEMEKIKVVMNKPVYLGQAILDLSKIVMYEFHYDYMKPKFKDPQVCYMDTDSLIHNMKTEDLYADIADDIPARFDTSGYCPNRPLPIGLNKKVISLMEDELGGAIMTEFIAPRPKLYSYKKLDGSEDKKYKGIKKCVVKKTLTFEDYKNCLFNSSVVYRSQLMFRSMKHDIFTIEVNKVTLNRDDDERISKKDGISIFARGHKDLSWSPMGPLGPESFSDPIFRGYHLSRTLNFLDYVKMPHSNFKWRATEFNSRVGKYPCGQTFECALERDMNMKLQLHHKFCSKPSKGFDKIRVPKKACMMREQQLNKAEKMRKVHN